MLRRLICLSLLAASTVCASGIWYPYMQIEGRGSNDYRQGGMAYGFAPLKQNNRSILFAQAQGGRLRHQTTAGLGGGYRHLISNDGFWGAALFGDWNRSDTGNHFWQFVASGELVLNCAEFRGNFYLPQRNGRQLERTSTTSLVVEDTNILERFSVSEQAEHAYSGFDLEAGLNREIGCCGRIRGYAAYYQYAKDGRKDIYGPRLRLRYELDNIKWEGTRLIVQGLWQYDKIRGTQQEVMAGFRFTPCKPKCPCPSSILRRMNDLVQRDMGIIYVKRGGITDVVDSDLGNIYFFAEGATGNGTQDNPTDVYSAMAASNPGDILFGLNDLGMIQLDQGPVALLDGQQLYSFDGQQTVEIPLPGGGLLPITDLEQSGQANLKQLNPAQPVVTAANDTLIYGLKLTDGTIGLEVNGVTNVLADQLAIDPPSTAGISLTNATNIQILNTTIDVEGATALSVSGGGNIAIANLMATTTTGPLVLIEGLVGPVTMDGSSLVSATGQGIHVQNGAPAGAVTVTTSSLTHAGKSIYINSTQAPIHLGGLQIDNTGTFNSTLIDVINAQAPVTFGQANLLNYNNLGQSAISLVSNTGLVSFAQTTIMGTGGTALFGTNNNQIDIAAGSINAQNAPAMHLVSSSADILLSFLNSDGSATSAAILDEAIGSLTVSGAANLVGTRTGLDVRNGSTIDITFGTLVADPVEDYGIHWADSAGSLEVTGLTTIGGLQANIASPTAIFCHNSTLDFTFDDVMIDGNNVPNSRGFDMMGNTGNCIAADVTTSDIEIGLYLNDPGDFTFNDLTVNPNCKCGINWNGGGGFFFAGDVIISQPGDCGIRVHTAATPNLFFSNLTLDQPNVGVIYDQAGGSLTVSGTTQITSPTGDGIQLINPTNPTLDFGDLTIATPGLFGIEWSLGTGSLTAATTLIDDPTNDGIAITSAAATLSFDALTINSPSTGILWDTSSGSFNVTNATLIDQPSGRGIYVFNATNPTLDFDDLTITSPSQFGIEWAGGTGSLTAGQTAITDAVQDGIYIGQADATVSFDTLNIDFNTVVGGNGVTLLESGGSFSVFNGGHIVHQIVGTQSGLLAEDCTGNISISGSDGDLFKITGCARAPAAIPLGGVIINSSGVPRLNELHLDCINVFDIGSGFTSTYGVLANSVEGEITISNSTFSGISTLSFVAQSAAISIVSPDQKSAPLTVLIEDNDISPGNTAGFKTVSGIELLYGSSEGRAIDCTISGNTLTELGNHLDVVIVGDSGTAAARNSLNFENNTLEDVTGFFGFGTIYRFIFNDSSESLLKLNNNQISYNPAAVTAIGNIGSTANFTGTVDIIATNNLLEGSPFIAYNINSAFNGTFTALFDNNDFGKTSDYQPFLAGAFGQGTLNLTISNSEAIGFHIYSQDSGTVNCLFGDPAGTNTMGNQAGDIAPGYVVDHQGGTFNLGGTGANAQAAIQGLGNTKLNLSPPVVDSSGTITIVAPGAIPQPTP